MSGSMDSHKPRTVKLNGLPYVVATANGKPAYSSGTRLLQQVPSDDFELTWDDWSGGAGVDYETSQNFLTTIKGRLVPRPSVTTLTPPVLPPDSNGLRWSFEAQDSNGIWYKYFVFTTWVYKVDISAATPVLYQAYTNAGRFGDANDFYGQPIKAIDSGTVRHYIPCNNGDRIAYIAGTVADERAAAVAYGTAATLTSDIDNATATVVYTSAGDPIAVNDMIEIDSEAMWVQAVNTGTNTLTVARAQRGTTAAAHTATAAIETFPGDTITVITTVTKGAAHFKQLPSGKIARATSSHSAGTAQNRAEVSLLAAGANFQTDANWAADFPVDDQTKWITGLQSYGELLVVAKPNGWFVATVLSDNTLKFESLLPDSIMGTTSALGSEIVYGSTAWHGRLMLSAGYQLYRSNIYSAKPVDVSSLTRRPFIYPQNGLTALRYPGGAAAGNEWLHASASPSGGLFLYLLAAREDEGELEWHPYYYLLASSPVAVNGAVHPQRNGGNSRIWWYDTALRCMPLDVGLSFSGDGAITYGQASLTASLWTMPINFPCQVQLREVRLTLLGTSTNAPWDIRAFRDSFGTTGEPVGSTLTATGSAFWTAGTNDTCRLLRLRVRSVMNTSYTPVGFNSDTTAPPTLIRMVLHGTYLPDVGEEIALSIDVPATAQLQGKSLPAIVSALEALVRTGAQTWTDYLGTTGHVNVLEKRRQPFIQNAAISSDDYVHIRLHLLEHA